MCAGSTVLLELVGAGLDGLLRLGLVGLGFTGLDDGREGIDLLIGPEEGRCQEDEELKETLHCYGLGKGGCKQLNNAS